MAAILLKCLQALTSFPDMTSITEATFFLHALPLEREKTRVTIKMPAPVIQPYASFTEVISFFFNYKIFILCCVLHPLSLACISKLPHCFHEKGTKINEVTCYL